MKSKLFAVLAFSIALFVAPLSGCGSSENKVMPKDDSLIDTPEEMEQYDKETTGSSDDEDQN
ncbi:MAG: hypothetical protein AAF958_10055 [Planctomycetota bacterium]